MSDSLYVRISDCISKERFLCGPVKIDTHSCRIGQYVVNLRFEVGVENSVTEMEHVQVCLCKFNSWISGKEVDFPCRASCKQIFLPSNKILVKDGETHIVTRGLRTRWRQKNWVDWNESEWCGRRTGLFQGISLVPDLVPVLFSHLIPRPGSVHGCSRSENRQITRSCGGCGSHTPPYYQRRLCVYYKRYSESEFLIDEFIETTSLGTSSPPSLNFISAREEKERNQNICGCFFSKYKNESRYVD